MHLSYEACKLEKHNNLGKLPVEVCLTLVQLLNPDYRAEATSLGKKSSAYRLNNPVDVSLDVALLEETVDLVGVVAGAVGREVGRDALLTEAEGLLPFRQGPIKSIKK